MANQAATVRVPAARRRRRDRAVELPGLHPDGLDRLRPGRRQRRRVQAERAHAGRRRAGWPTTFAEVVPEHPVFQVVTGLGETGAALCRAGVEQGRLHRVDGDRQEGDGRLRRDPHPGRDRGRRQGRRPRRRGRRPRRRRRRRRSGAPAPTPGQTCIGVERVYVARAGVRRVPRPAASTRRSDLRAEDSPDAQDRADHDAQPARRHPARTSTTRSTRGGRAVLGGPDAVGERYVQPTILVDVPEDSSAVQEETFGPTVTVTRVRDMDEAVGAGQRHPLRPRLDGVRQGARRWRSPERIRSGMTAVNGVITFAAIPTLPFGGVGRLRVRPDPRTRRAQGVHLRQGDRPTAVQAGAGADHVHAAPRRPTSS